MAKAPSGLLQQHAEPMPERPRWAELGETGNSERSALEGMRGVRARWIGCPEFLWYYNRKEGSTMVFLDECGLQGRCRSVSRLIEEHERSRMMMKTPLEGEKSYLILKLLMKTFGRLGWVLQDQH